MTQARIQFLAGGLLIVTFAVGCLVGAASDRVLNAREPGPTTPVATAKSGTEHSGKARARLIDATMLDEIGVTPSQRVVIDSILNMRDREAKLLWKEWEPRFKAMISQTRGQVRAQLTPEQIKQLDVLIEQRRALRKQNQPAPQQNDVQNDTKSEKHNQAPSEEKSEPGPRRFESIALQ